MTDDTAVLMPPTSPEPLTADGVRVLLVYGASIRVSTGDQPGIRVTAGYHNGSVLLEAVGFYPAWSGEALVALDEAVRACSDAGLVVNSPPPGLSNFPARRIHRRLQ